MTLFQTLQILAVILGVTFLLAGAWEIHKTRIKKDASMLGIYLILLMGVWGAVAVVFGGYGVRHGWLHDITENEARLFIIASCALLWLIAWPISKKLRRRPGWYA